MSQQKLNKSKSKITLMISHQRYHYLGFTVIELMIVVMIISLIAAIAFPSYQAYTRKSSMSAAEQEMQKLAEQLERHKSKNFTYRNFDPKFTYGGNSNTPALNEIILPYGAIGSAVKYRITVRDLDDTTKLLTSSNVKGRGWSIRAETDDIQNDNLLMTSEGLRCRAKGKANVTYTSCGANSGTW